MTLDQKNTSLNIDNLPNKNDFKKQILFQIALFFGFLLLGFTILLIITAFIPENDFDIGLPYLTLIIPSLGRTIDVCFISFLISLPAVMILGKLAAKDEDGLLNRIVSFISKFYFSIPLFLIGIMLQYLSVIETGIQTSAGNFMSAGMELLYASDVKLIGFPLLDALLRFNFAMIGDILQHIFLPCLILSTIFFSILFPAIRENNKKKKPLIQQTYSERTSIHAFNYNIILVALLFVELTFNISGINNLFNLTSYMFLDKYTVNVGALIYLLLFLLLNLSINLRSIFRDKKEVNKEIENKGTTNKSHSFVKLETNGKKTSNSLLQYLKNPSSILGILLLSFLIVLAILASILFDKMAVAGADTTILPYAPPSSEHILGTAKFGRDVLGGVLFGIRRLLLISLGISLGAFLIGCPIGIYSGFKGGKKGKIFSHIGNIFIVIPYIVIFFGISLYGQIVFNIVGTNWAGLISSLFISMIFVSQLTRKIAIGTLSDNEEIRTSKQLVTQIFPKLISLFFTFATLIALISSFLGFISIFMDPNQVDLGHWVQSGSFNLDRAPHVAFWPGFAIFLTTFSFMLISQGFSFPPLFGKKKRIKEINADVDRSIETAI